MTRDILQAVRFFALVLVALSLLSCNRPPETEKAAEKSSNSTPAAASKALALTDDEVNEAGIKVEPVQPQTVTETISLTGTITPNLDKLAKVTPRLPGRVTSVPVALGGHVKSGQILAVLESIELGEARAAYLQTKSEAAVAEAALTRAQKLAAEDIVPQKDYLRAKGDAERSRAALRAASDKLKLLGVSASEPEGQHAAAYPIIAPFAGTIIEKKAVIGELAQPDQALFTLADLTKVWLEADAFEKDLGKLVINAASKVTVAAYPETAFEGKLAYVSDTMDKTTRTVKTRIEIPNPDGRLKPGMFATAQLRSSATAKALIVPDEAVLLVQGQPTVFVAAAKGFAPRTVETGSAVDGKVQIKAGLAPGDSVVVSGAYTLKARLLKSQISTED